MIVHDDNFIDALAGRLRRVYRIVTQDDTFTIGDVAAVFHVNSGDYSRTVTGIKYL
jgi:hypothetical protein